MKTITSLIFSLIFVSGLAANAAISDDTNNSAGSSASSMMSDASYMVITGDSKMNWLAKKTGGQHNGRVSITEGAFQVSNGKMITGEFVIDMTTITVDDIESQGMNKKLVNHLKNEDFFNVEAHPAAYFKMTEGRFVEVDDGTDRYEVTGSLTIKDISHDISFNAYVSDGNTRIRTDEIVLDRTKWDVNFKSKTVFAQFADSYIHDEMYISIELAVE